MALGAQCRFRGYPVIKADITLASSFTFTVSWGGQRCRMRELDAGQSVIDSNHCEEELSRREGWWTER